MAQVANAIAPLRPNVCPEAGKVHRTDVYSLACVLFEALVRAADRPVDRGTGTMPRNGDRAPTTLRTRSGRRPASASEIAAP
jgi:hypothetical protein